ncbi:hypothetical protein A0J61_10921 [Choanephora cucurbitarum]|uniref:Uncharacterized protein n=1 Tax=Choanephora cucurbitarum TaxID=101091 RepID=A0A1C7MW22_9FUNG|nr:hypothetical protein A0J61_10921 [Choanephora cucurbitarum]
MRYSAKFICHRSDSYASVACDEGRPTQKKYKKAGCTASLNIKCYFKEPEVYHSIPVVQDYAFHIPGDQVDDLRCLPLSRRYLWKIQNVLKHSSKSDRQTRIDLLREMDKYGGKNERRVNYHDVGSLMNKVLSLNFILRGCLI